MRAICVAPGATWSVSDVFSGLVGGLRTNGVEVIPYALDARLDNAVAWLSYSWRRSKRTVPKPTQGDAMYLACSQIIERALRFNVDWVICVSGFYIHPDALIMLRRAHKRVALVFTESPYEDAGQLKHAQYADVIWVNDRTSVERFRQVHPNVHYWQHAIDLSRHVSGLQPEDEKVRSHDVVFVGSGFIERVNMLRAVNWDGIDLGLYGTWWLVGSRNKLREHIAGDVVPNKEAAALYRRARIGLNLYRSSVGSSRDTEHVLGAESINPRAYEFAACGLFYLSEYRAESEEIFGDAVPTFKTPKELGELVRYYLAHPDEREQRAARLPGLVARHTFDARASDMVRVLSEFKTTP